MKPPHALLMEELRQQGIRDPRVLDAIANVPREHFIEEDLAQSAYENRALPIGHGQTISQPFIVARMTELLLQEGHLNKVLEIGTGSGYQAAVLAALVPEVYTVERINSLYQQAKQRFARWHYTNIHQRYGDGFLGWKEHEPYDGILVTAAAQEIPTCLLEQLADGGRLILPLAQGLFQTLQLIKRVGDRWESSEQDGVIFVPLLRGEA